MQQFEYSKAPVKNRKYEAIKNIKKKADIIIKRDFDIFILILLKCIQSTDIKFFIAYYAALYGRGYSVKQKFYFLWGGAISLLALICISLAATPLLNNVKSLFLPKHHFPLSTFKTVTLNVIIAKPDEDVFGYNAASLRDAALDIFTSKIQDSFGKDVIQTGIHDEEHTFEDSPLNVEVVLIVARDYFNTGYTVGASVRRAYYYTLLYSRKDKDKEKYYADLMHGRIADYVNPVIQSDGDQTHVGNVIVASDKAELFSQINQLADEIVAEMNPQTDRAEQLEDELDRVVNFRNAKGR